jgi:hypothetical protein
MTDRRDPSPHNVLIRFWCDEYEKRIGTKYPFNGGKDAKTIQWLRGLYSDEDIRGFICAFFEIEDEFIQNSGYSLGVFRGCLPKVIQFVNRGQQQAPKKVPSNLQGLQAWSLKRAAGE